jgi:small subunit ribosomal protein S3Ae
MSERSVSRQQRQKRWYTVLAPESFDRAELGETPANEPEGVLGRTIETTLGELTNDAGANNVKLTFGVTDVGSDAAYTEFRSHEHTRDYLNSLVRRGASKIAAYRTVLTADDYRVRIQPVAFTTQSADHSQERAIRRRMTDLVEEAAAERSFEALVDSVVQGRLSSAIYGEARTIYPLRRVEIAKLTLDAHPAEVEAEQETAVDVDREDADVEA